MLSKHQIQGRFCIGRLEFDFYSTWNSSQKSLMFHLMFLFCKSKVHFETSGSSRLILFWLPIFRWWFFKNFRHGNMKPDFKKIKNEGQLLILDFIFCKGFNGIESRLRIQYGYNCDPCLLKTFGFLPKNSRCRTTSFGRSPKRLGNMSREDFHLNEQKLG